MSPCAKGAAKPTYVKVGFSTIARAAKTIVNESFLVFKLFSSIGCFNAAVTYLRVATQKRVMKLG